jgi:LysM repeat protein
MGTFEKLGILVIVVIIVMILAVAIYQWGGAAGPPPAVVAAPELQVTTRDYLDGVIGPESQQPLATQVTETAEVWPGGIPKRYRVERDDKVWLLVVKKWRLKEGFVDAVESANPKVNFARLKPGQELLIPDPSKYVRTPAGQQPAPTRESSRTRRYEVQTGDTLESIAYRYLGAKSRWADIVSLNPGLEPKRLFEGQEIYLPVK